MDTDHTTGGGQVAITGKYDSMKESFVIDANYALDDANTLYASYGVTDEKLTALGLETGFTAFGKRNTFDATYSPSTDAAKLKVAIRQGKVKASGVFSFNNVQKSKVSERSDKYELDVKLSSVESLKMAYDVKRRATKVKLSRKLDPKNKLDAEYSYVDSTSKFVSLTFKHQYSKVHGFGVVVDYGAKKYKVDWDCKTDNGPWTVSAMFPFTTRYVHPINHSNSLMNLFALTILSRISVSSLVPTIVIGPSNAVLNSKHSILQTHFTCFHHKKVNVHLLYLFPCHQLISLLDRCRSVFGRNQFYCSSLPSSLSILQHTYFCIYAVFSFKICTFVMSIFIPTIPLFLAA